MAILIKSKTDLSAKNRFGTDWNCFFDACYVFQRDMGKQFVLDVAAEANTAKVNRYYASAEYLESLVSGYDGLKPNHATAQILKPKCVGINALTGEWEDGWWCNPPFDQKFDFIAKAIEQARKGNDGMMLLPYEPLTGWWMDRVEGYATMVYKPRGRYSFYEPNGKTIRKNVNFGSALVLFSCKGLETPSRIIQRKEWRDSGSEFIYRQIVQAM